MKRYGIAWTRDYDTWRGIMHGRYHLVTWPFGSIHQCVIAPEYKFGDRDVTFTDKRVVWIGRKPCESRDAAMKLGIDWVQGYVVSGPPTPAQLFGECFDRWRRQYRTRLDVMTHWLCVVGSGYRWLDGAIVNTSVDDWEEYCRRAKDPADAALGELEEIIKKYEPGHRLIEKDMVPGPFPDLGAPLRGLGLDKKYSNLCKVPGDVRAEWLELALEMANVAKLRADTAKDRALAAWALEDIKRRFA